MNPDAQYRRILANEFSQRAARNAAYSQRAFARDIGLSPASLTGVLKGHHGLSHERARRIVQCLDLDSATAELFCTSVQAAHERSPRVRLESRSRLKNLMHSNTLTPLDGARFSILSDWLHFAILELSKTNAFSWNKKYIAGRLKASLPSVAKAIERLVEGGFLKKSKTGYERIKDSHFAGNVDYSKAIRDYHGQIIHKAASAVLEQTSGERELQALQIALSNENFELIRARVRKFFQDLECEFGSLSQASSHEVYCLSTQFFKTSFGSETDRAH